MKLLVASILLVATNAFAQFGGNPAMDMPSMDMKAMDKAITQAVVNYAYNVVGMQGQVKVVYKSGLLKTKTTVIEKASGCSFQAKVALKNWGWAVKEVAGTNTCN